MEIIMKPNPNNIKLNIPNKKQGNKYSMGNKNTYIKTMSKLTSAVGDTFRKPKAKTASIGIRG